MANPISVMGLDGSLANFGIAVATLDTDTNEIIEVKDLILSKSKPNKKLKRAEDDFARFNQHWDCIRNTATKYDVKVMYGEIPSGAQDARAAFAFGGITAMLGGLALDYDLTTVTPAEVKVAATGDRHADKEDIIEEMHSRFPTAPWITSKRENKMNITTSSGLFLTNANEHLADSIGVILAGVKK